MTVTIKGELEIDPSRGVIYFHSEKTGITALRICRIAEDILRDVEENDEIEMTADLIDITMGITKPRETKIKKVDSKTTKNHTRWNGLLRG